MMGTREKKVQRFIKDELRLRNISIKRAVKEVGVYSNALNEAVCVRRSFDIYDLFLQYLGKTWTDVALELRGEDGR